MDGGRVLDLVGIGSSVSEARDRAYEAVAAVSWPGMQHRRHRRSVVAVAEHEGDTGRGRGALGDGVLPQPLTGATHHHQIPSTEVEPVDSPPPLGRIKNLRGPPGDRGDDGLGPVAGEHGRRAMPPSRGRFDTSRRSPDPGAPDSAPSSSIISGITGCASAGRSRLGAAS